MSIEKYTVEVWKKEEMPYTMVPNHVVQNMVHEPLALSLWMFLITLPSDWKINKQFIMNKFKWGRDKVNKCLSVLEKNNLLEKYQERSQQGTFDQTVINILNGTKFNISKDIPLTENTPFTENTGHGDNRSLENTVTVKQEATNTNIYNTNKEFIKNTNDHRKKRDVVAQEKSFVLPTQINKDMWEDFIQHRKDIKAPMSYVAQRRAINALERFIKEGQDVNTILEQSIVNGWKGLFAVKSMENGYGKFNGNDGRNGEKEFDLGEALRKGKGDHPGFMLNPNL